MLANVLEKGCALAVEDDVDEVLIIKELMIIAVIFIMSIYS